MKGSAPFEIKLGDRVLKINLHLDETSLFNTLEALATNWSGPPSSSTPIIGGSLHGRSSIRSSISGYRLFTSPAGADAWIPHDWPEGDELRQIALARIQGGNHG